MENHSFQGLSENQDKTKALSSEILVDAENNDDELSSGKLGLAQGLQHKIFQVTLA